MKPPSGFSHDYVSAKLRRLGREDFPISIVARIQDALFPSPSCNLTSGDTSHTTTSSRQPHTSAMPLTAESMTQQVPGPSLASGVQLSSSRPHPLILELWTKCPSGSAEEVEHLLNEIGPLPPVDDIPTAALHCLQEAVLRSAYNPDRGVLRVLLRHGFSTYKLSCQLVDKAFAEGNTRTLAALIEGGWNVNEAGPGLAARPLLRHAVNDTEMRKFLLRHGADPLVENERRLTALETAAGWSSTEVLEELIAHGGDPRGDDSLLHAVESGRLDNARVLVAHGADVNQLEKVYPHPWGQAPRRRPLDVATGRCPPSETSVAPHPQVEALWKKGVEMRDWLISQGATKRNSERSS